MNREAAWSLLTEFTQSESLRKHALAVEACMRAYAKKFAEDEEKFGITGLLATALFAQGYGLGLGVGGLERVAAYTLPVWLITGGALIVSKRLTSTPPNNSLNRSAK